MWFILKWMGDEFKGHYFEAEIHIEGNFTFLDFHMTTVSHPFQSSIINPNIIEWKQVFKQALDHFWILTMQIFIPLNLSCAIEFAFE